jgi:hypothetical protein
MAQILPNWRVTLAVLFSAVIIVGSFVITRSVESPPTAQASAETALLQAIAAKDSDGDGLPDWEEALYGTDPHIVDTFHLGMTDGEAVAKGLIVPKAVADIKAVTSTSTTVGVDGLPPPAAEGTLTSAFSQKFLQLYISAKQANGGADLSSTDTANIAAQVMDSLNSTVVTAPDYKSGKDLTISGAGAAALTTFAADAQVVILKNAAKETTDEITYLGDAIENSDPVALTHLANIAKANRDTAVALAALPVPIELSADDLFLINSIMRVSEIVNDFAHEDSDPLTAMLALQQYLQATQNLWQAFANIHSDYSVAGVVLAPGTPGAAFVNLTSTITALQAKQKP